MASMLMSPVFLLGPSIYAQPSGPRPSPIPVQPFQSSDSVVVLSSEHFRQFRRLNKLPRQYRNSRTGARSTRTQIDHDVFEGLPVRHWRKKPIKVDISPEKENVDETDPGKQQWKELQMPRDYHLLPQVSQDLLRAARMPQTKKQAAPVPEDEKELGDEDDADGELDTGFVAKRWALVPKELERPEPEFLAKRRKGLPSAHSGALAIAPVRKIKVRKVDADGHSSVWEVLVPEGQTVDGEVVEGEISPTQAPAPGTVVQGVGVVNAEGVVIAGDQGVPGVNKRRPPPPKRRPKGPGRGRKKKVAFAGADGLPTTNVPDGTTDSAIKTEDEKGPNGHEGALGGSTEMTDGSLLKDGDQEGEEGSEEGSEEDEGEEGDREEGELSPSASPLRSSPKPPLSITAEAGTAPEAQDSGMLQSPSKSQIAAKYSPKEALLEDAAEHVDKEMEIYKNEPMDEMLDDTMHDQMSESSDPTNEMLDESTVAAAPQDPGEVSIENMQDPAMDIAMEPITDAPSETRTDGIAYKLEIVDDLSTQADARPIAEIAEEHVKQPSTTSPLSQPEYDAALEHSTGTATEPMPGPDVYLSEDAAIHPTMEPMIQSIPSPFTETLRESTPQAGPSAAKEATTVSEKEPEPSTEPIVEQEIEATPQTILEHLPASPAQAMTESVTELITEVPGPPIADLAPPKRSPEPPNDPIDERTSDPLADVHAYNERKYSITRPTASPKAPTPSPPTPIETKFSSLQPPDGPYFSPKAPTMSPPTPIRRSMSSSPDISHLDQPYQLPPQMDLMSGARSLPGLGTLHIPDADLVSVEAAPEVEAKVNAKIPVDHNPLDGIAAPELADSEPGEAGDGDGTAHFSDGEEDLLGGLERSLGPRSRD